MATETPDDDRTQSFLALTAGTTVLHYRIVDKIGSGGMGEVYLALDNELNRKVALKFLPSELCGDDECRKRFNREAQAAAGLDHPNIAAIYEVGEYGGRPFYAMQVIEGQSLREVIAGKDLPIDQIVEIAIQVSEGLQAAHDSGIIHRDIKPSNVLIDSHGRVRIVDFGLATIRGSENLTRTGSTLGTIGYMSPEQVDGREVDHRSDLFSLGVVLYEMITKQNPFKRDSDAATLKAVSDYVPHPVARYRADVPEELQKIVDKAIDKDVSLRYQHATGLIADLKRLTRAVQFEARDADTSPSIAVLPFDDLSQGRDQQYLCDGLTEELISALACIRGLRVVSRTSSFAFQSTHEDIRAIGRKLNVSTLLEGSVRRAGDRIRVTAQLIEAETGYHLWNGKFDRQMEDLFAIEDEVTASIVSALRPELLREKAAVVRPQTTNLEAYNEYLLGLALWNTRTDDGLRKSLDHFSRAASLDPEYSMAHCGIADAYNVMAGYCLIYPSTGLEKSMEAAQRALEINPKLGEAHGRLAMNLWELQHAISDAEKEFNIALQLSPSSTIIMNGFAEMLAALGRFDEAARLTKTALTLDPLGRIARLHEAGLALVLGQHETAEFLNDKMLEMDPQFTPALRYKCEILAAKGNVGAACDTAARLLEMSGGHPMDISYLGYLSGLAGNESLATDCLTRLDTLKEEYFVPSYERALIHLGMNDHEKALAELERGVEEGYCRILMINIDLKFRPLKKHAKFTEIVKRLNLE
jgi:TolB-like protein/Tfp pilus assembly protein PilF/predicted Ser/Thr protein kinase